MSIISVIKNLKRKLIKKDTSVLYIHGPQSLPAPLPPEKENELIGKIAFDNEARMILIEHNLRLVVYIAKRFENTGVGIEDLISIGTIGLIKGVNTFEPTKNIKLATYASRCIENEILMYIRKSSNQRNDMSIEEPLNIDWDGNELLLCDVLGPDDDSVYRNIESGEEKKILLDAIKTLNKRDREIIILRFALGGGREYTQKEVAEKMGISQSYISRLEKKIISKLKNEIGIL